MQFNALCTTLLKPIRKPFDRARPVCLVLTKALNQQNWFTLTLNGVMHLCSAGKVIQDVPKKMHITAFPYGRRQGFCNSLLYSRMVTTDNRFDSPPAALPQPHQGGVLQIRLAFSVSKFHRMHTTPAVPIDPDRATSTMRLRQRWCASPPRSTVSWAPLLPLASTPKQGQLLQRKAISLDGLNHFFK